VCRVVLYVVFIASFKKINQLTPDRASRFSPYLEMFVAQ
jgi:hypothetical protein